MVRMFGYVGAARLKQRLTPLIVSLAAGALACWTLGMFSRHVSYLLPLRPYASFFRLAGSVLTVIYLFALQHRDARLSPGTEKEI